MRETVSFRHRPIKKTLASALAVVMAAEVALVPLAQARSEESLWKERRAAGTRRADPPDLLAQLPAPSFLASRSAAPLSSSLPALQFPALKTILHAVPGRSAVIRKAHAGGPRAVVLIQDVHLNPEAQGHIAAVLSGLLAKARPSVVGVEGAFKAFDFLPFRRLPDSRFTADLARAFLGKNLLGAASLVGITSSGELPPFVGVDDAAGYRANVEAYLAAQANRPSIEKSFESAKTALAAEKARAYSSELRWLDERQSAYDEGRLGFGDYVAALGGKAESDLPAAVHQFLEAYRMEKALDFDRADRERRRAMEILVPRMSEGDFTRLYQQTMAFRSGDLAFGAYYQHLAALCESRGVALDRLPAFRDYMRYAALSEGIDPDGLFEGLKKLEIKLANRFAASETERALVQRSRLFRLTAKLISFEMTPGEWEEYKELSASQSAGQAVIARNEVTKQSRSGREVEIASPAFGGLAMTALQPFEDFYRRADERSHAMVENLFKAVPRTSYLGHRGTRYEVPGPAVMIAGGFHTDLIGTLLKERGLSYVVVSPKITRVDDAAGSAYLSVFSRDKTPLDRLFAGEKLFVYPHHVNAGAGPGGTFLAVHEAARDEAAARGWVEAETGALPFAEDVPAWETEPEALQATRNGELIGDAPLVLDTSGGPIGVRPARRSLPVRALVFIGMAGALFVGGLQSLYRWFTARAPPETTEPSSANAGEPFHWNIATWIVRALAAAAVMGAGWALLTYAPDVVTTVLKWIEPQTWGAWIRGTDVAVPPTYGFFVMGQSVTYTRLIFIPAIATLAYAFAFSAIAWLYTKMTGRILTTTRGQAILHFFATEEDLRGALLRFTGVRKAFELSTLPEDLDRPWDAAFRADVEEAQMFMRRLSEMSAPELRGLYIALTKQSARLAAKKEAHQKSWAAIFLEVVNPVHLMHFLYSFFFSTYVNQVWFVARGQYQDNMARLPKNFAQLPAEEQEKVRSDAERDAMRLVAKTADQKLRTSAVGYMFWFFRWHDVFFMGYFGFLWKRWPMLVVGFFGGELLSWIAQSEAGNQILESKVRPSFSSGWGRYAEIIESKTDWDVKSLAGNAFNALGLMLPRTVLSVARSIAQSFADPSPALLQRLFPNERIPSDWTKDARERGLLPKGLDYADLIRWISVPPASLPVESLKDMPPAQRAFLEKLQGERTDLLLSMSAMIRVAEEQRRQMRFVKVGRYSAGELGMLRERTDQALAASSLSGDAMAAAVRARSEELRQKVRSWWKSRAYYRGLLNARQQVAKNFVSTFIGVSFLDAEIAVVLELSGDLGGERGRWGAEIFEGRHVKNDAGEEVDLGGSGMSLAQDVSGSLVAIGRPLVGLDPVRQDAPVRQKPGQAPVEPPASEVEPAVVAKGGPGGGPGPRVEFFDLMSSYALSLVGMAGQTETAPAPRVVDPTVELQRELDRRLKEAERLATGAPVPLDRFKDKNPDAVKRHAADLKEPLERIQALHKKAQADESAGKRAVEIRSEVNSTAYAIARTPDWRVGADNGVPLRFATRADLDRYLIQAGNRASLYVPPDAVGALRREGFTLAEDGRVMDPSQLRRLVELGQRQDRSYNLRLVIEKEMSPVEMFTQAMRMGLPLLGRAWPVPVTEQFEIVTGYRAVMEDFVNAEPDLAITGATVEQLKNKFDPESVDKNPILIEGQQRAFELDPFKTIFNLTNQNWANFPWFTTGALHEVPRFLTDRAERTGWGLWMPSMREAVREIPHMNLYPQMPFAILRQGSDRVLILDPSPGAATWARDIEAYIFASKFITDEVMSHRLSGELWNHTGAWPFYLERDYERLYGRDGIEKARKEYGRQGFWAQSPQYWKHLQDVLIGDGRVKRIEDRDIQPNDMLYLPAIQRPKGLDGTDNAKWYDSNGKQIHVPRHGKHLGVIGFRVVAVANESELRIRREDYRRFVDWETRHVRKHEGPLPNPNTMVEAQGSAGYRVDAPLLAEVEGNLDFIYFNPRTGKPYWLEKMDPKDVHIAVARREKGPETYYYVRDPKTNNWTMVDERTGLPLHQVGTAAGWVRDVDPEDIRVTWVTSAAGRTPFYHRRDPETGDWYLADPHTGKRQGEDPAPKWFREEQKKNPKLVMRTAITSDRGSRYQFMRRDREDGEWYYVDPKTGARPDDGSNPGWYLKAKAANEKLVSRTSVTSGSGTKYHFYRRESENDPWRQVDPKTGEVDTTAGAEPGWYREAVKANDKLVTRTSITTSRGTEYVFYRRDKEGDPWRLVDPSTGESPRGGGEPAWYRKAKSENENLVSRTSVTTGRGTEYVFYRRDTVDGPWRLVDPATGLVPGDQEPDWYREALKANDKLVLRTAITSAGGTQYIFYRRDSAEGEWRLVDPKTGGVPDDGREPEWYRAAVKANDKLVLRTSVTSGSGTRYVFYRRDSTEEEWRLVDPKTGEIPDDGRTPPWYREAVKANPKLVTRTSITTGLRTEYVYYRRETAEGPWRLVDPKTGVAPADPATAPDPEWVSKAKAAGDEVYRTSINGKVIYYRKDKESGRWSIADAGTGKTEPDWVTALRDKGIEVRHIDVHTSRGFTRQYYRKEKDGSWALMDANGRTTGERVAKGTPSSIHQWGGTTEVNTVQKGVDLKVGDRDIKLPILRDNRPNKAAQVLVDAEGRMLTDPKTNQPFWITDRQLTELRDDGGNSWVVVVDPRDGRVVTREKILEMDPAALASRATYEIYVMSPADQDKILKADMSNAGQTILKNGGFRLLGSEETLQMSRDQARFDLAFAENADRLQQGYLKERTAAAVDPMDGALDDSIEIHSNEALTTMAKNGDVKILYRTPENGAWVWKEMDAATFALRHWAHRSTDPVARGDYKFVRVKAGVSPDGGALPANSEVFSVEQLLMRGRLLAFKNGERIHPKDVHFLSPDDAAGVRYYLYTGQKDANPDTRFARVMDPTPEHFLPALWDVATVRHPKQGIPYRSILREIRMDGEAASRSSYREGTRNLQMKKSEVAVKLLSYAAVAFDSNGRFDPENPFAYLSGAARRPEDVENLRGTVVRTENITFRFGRATLFDEDGRAVGEGPSGSVLAIDMVADNGHTWTIELAKGKEEWSHRGKVGAVKHTLDYRIPKPEDIIPPWPDTSHANDRKRKLHAFMVSQEGKLYAAPWQRLSDYPQWLRDYIVKGGMDQNFDASILKYNFQPGEGYPFVPTTDRPSGILTFELKADGTVEVRPVAMGAEEAAKRFRQSLKDLIYQIKKEEEGDPNPNLIQDRAQLPYLTGVQNYDWVTGQVTRFFGVEPGHKHHKAYYETDLDQTLRHRRQMADDLERDTLDILIAAHGGLSGRLTKYQFSGWTRSMPDTEWLMFTGLPRDNVRELQKRLGPRDVLGPYFDVRTFDYQMRLNYDGGLRGAYEAIRVREHQRRTAQERDRVVLAGGGFVHVTARYDSKTKVQDLAVDSTVDPDGAEFRAVFNAALEGGGTMSYDASRNLWRWGKGKIAYTWDGQTLRKLEMTDTRTTSWSSNNQGRYTVPHTHGQEGRVLEVWHNYAPKDEARRLVEIYDQMLKNTPAHAELLQKGGYILVDEDKRQAVRVMAGDEAYQRAVKTLDRVKDPVQQLRAARTMTFRGPDPEGELPGEFTIVISAGPERMKDHLTSMAVDPSLIPNMPALAALKKEAARLFAKLPDPDKEIVRKRTDGIVQWQKIQTPGQGGGAIVLKADGSFLRFESASEKLTEEVRQALAKNPAGPGNKFVRPNGEVVIVQSDPGKGSIQVARWAGLERLLRHRLARLEGTKPADVSPIRIETEDTRTTHLFDPEGFEIEIVVEVRAGGEWKTQVRYAAVRVEGKPAADVDGNALFEGKDPQTGETVRLHMSPTGNIVRRATPSVEEFRSDFFFNAAADEYQPGTLLTRVAGKPAEFIRTTFDPVTGDRRVARARVDAVAEGKDVRYRIGRFSIEEYAGRQIKELREDAGRTSHDPVRAAEIARDFDVPEVRAPLKDFDEENNPFATYKISTPDVKGVKTMRVERTVPGLPAGENTWTTDLQVRNFDPNGRRSGRRLVVVRESDPNGEVHYSFDKPNAWNLPSEIRGFRRTRAGELIPSETQTLKSIRPDAEGRFPVTVINHATKEESQGWVDFKGRRVGTFTPAPVPKGGSWVPYRKNRTLFRLAFLESPLVYLPLLIWAAQVTPWMWFLAPLLYYAPHGLLEPRSLYQNKDVLALTVIKLVISGIAATLTSQGVPAAVIVQALAIPLAGLTFGHMALQILRTRELDRQREDLNRALAVPDPKEADVRRKLIEMSGLVISYNVSDIDGRRAAGSWADVSETVTSELERAAAADPNIDLNLSLRSVGRGIRSAFTGEAIDDRVGGSLGAVYREAEATPGLQIVVQFIQGNDEVAAARQVEAALTRMRTREMKNVRYVFVAEEQARAAIQRRLMWIANAPAAAVNIHQVPNLDRLLAHPAVAKNSAFGSRADLDRAAYHFIAPDDMNLKPYTRNLNPAQFRVYALILEYLQTPLVIEIEGTQSDRIKKLLAGWRHA